MSKPAQLPRCRASQNLPVCFIAGSWLTIRCESHDWFCRVSLLFVFDKYEFLFTSLNISIKIDCTKAPRYEMFNSIYITYRITYSCTKSVEHDKINSISSRNYVLLSLLKTVRMYMNVSRHFPKIAEDYRRIRTCFDTNKFAGSFA